MPWEGKLTSGLHPREKRRGTQDHCEHIGNSMLFGSLFFSLDHTVSSIVCCGAEFAMLSRLAGKAVADKTVETSALEGALEQYLESMPTRDLCALTRNMQANVTWKNAPKASTMGEYAPMFVKIAAVCPNGVILPKKLAMALVAVHNKKPINFSQMKTEHFGDFYSELIRAAFSKFRAVLNDEDGRARLFAKAGLRLTKQSNTYPKHHVADHNKHSICPSTNNQMTIQSEGSGTIVIGRERELGSELQT
jgi:hypothetical protein